MSSNLSSRIVVNRTIAAGIAVLMLIGAVVLVAFANVQQQTQQMDIARQVASHVSEMRFIVLETVLYNETRPAVQWENKIATTRAVLQSPVFSDALDKEILGRIRQNFDVLDVLYDRIRLHSTMEPTQAEDAARNREIVARSVSSLLVATQEMGSHAFELANRNQDRAEQALVITRWSVGIGLAVLVLLLLALRRVVDRRILKPVAIVQEGTEQIASGNLSFRFDQVGLDEIGMLASRFNDMSVQLERSHNALMQEVEERRIAQQQVLAVNRELVRAVARADSASRTKSEFLANMSHEIRTPLNGILGMTQLALRTPLTPIQQEYLGIVQESGASLLRVINDILDFSKMEAGKLDLIHEEFDLRERIAACLRGFTSAVSDKNVELAFRVDADVPRVVSGDAARFIQVLSNLVCNAIKFTERGEVLVKVSVADTDDGDMALQFDVHDTGIGIEPAHQQKVFEMFAQADSSTTREYGGTGLGLAICLQLVRMMKGRLWLDSTPGAGSVFHFTASFGKVTAPTASAEPMASLASGATVLVVDDNFTNRCILDEQLRSRGLVPVLCDSGASALHQLGLHAARGTPIPLVLADEAMPAMNGLQFAQRALTKAKYGKPRLIMLSFDGQFEASGKQLPGIVQWLRKPVIETELFSALDAALSGAVPQPAADRAPSGMAPVEAARRPLRLLLVEDQPINRKLASTVLLKRGHTVVMAATGLEAIAQFRQGAFDAILMDIQMPEMDGYRAAAEIRAIEAKQGGRVRIVAVTAHALEREHRRCLEAGMDSVLIKPYLPEQLMAAAEGSADGAAPVARKPLSPAPALATGEDGVLDLEAALRRVLGKRKILSQMAAMFVNDAPMVVQSLRDAVAASDAGRLMQEAHRIKGSAGIFGATAVVSAAQVLEQVGKSGNLDNATSCLAQFEEDMARLSAALQEIMIGEVA